MRCCPSTETMLAIRQDNAAFLEDTCILEQCGKAQTIVMVLHFSQAKMHVACMK